MSRSRVEQISTIHKLETYSKPNIEWILLIDRLKSSLKKIEGEALRISSLTRFLITQLHLDLFN